MKNLLPFAALLLSSVAQADTYYCKTEVQALVNSVTVESQSDKLKNDFVVDLKLGVKDTDKGDYKGACDYETLGKANVIRCSETSEYSTETLTIFLQSLEFTQINDNYAYVIATGGICTKI